MYAWITLQEMGKRDDTKSRRTREFDSARLAALTREQAAEAEAQAQSEVQQIAAAAAEQQDISVARAATLDDPMTTGLLAEVARRSQTTDFDDDLIKEVLTKIDSGETSHPHTRRRTR
jgi:hypothetical protein